MPRTDRRVERRPPLALGAVLVATLPVLAYLVVVVRHAGGSPMLGGDVALIEMWTRSATDLDAYVGPYSRVGWNHPGPMVFYWNLPFYVLSGQTLGGLGVAATTLVIVNLATVSVIVTRVRGRRGAVAGTIVILGFLVVSGTGWFDNMWNPAMAVTPTIVAGAAAAAVVDGRRWCLLVTAIAGSFAVQTHLGALPVVGVFTATAFVGVFVRARREPAAWRTPSLVALAATLMCWSLPVYEQVTRRSGNLSEILESSAETSGADHSLSAVLDTTASQFTFTASDVMTVALRDNQPITSAMPWSAAWWIVVLAVAVATAGWSFRARQWFECALCGSGALASVALVFALVGVDGPLRPYLTFTSLAAGFVIYLGLALTAARLIGANVADGAAWLRAATGITVVGSVALTAWTLARNPHDTLVALRTEPEGSDAVTQAVEDVLVPGAHVLIEVREFDRWPDAAAIANELERSGMDIAAEPELLWMFGDQRTPDGCERYAVEFARVDDATQPVGGISFGATSVEVRELEVSGDC